MLVAMDETQDDGPAIGPGVFLALIGFACLYMGIDLATGGKLTAGLVAVGLRSPHASAVPAGQESSSNAGA